MKKDDERLYLSMQILTDYMDDQFSDYYFYRGNDPMVLEDVRLYYGQAEISEKFVYIVKPGYLQKAMENNCNIVLIGKVELPKITPQYHKSIIHIPKNERVEYILELIQNIFHKFRKWEMDLVQILTEEGDLAAMCKCSQDIFQNPIYVLDHNNNAIVRTTYVVGMMTMKPDPNTGSLILPVERRNLLYHSEEFLQTYKTKTAQYWTPSWNKHRDIYVNVFDEYQRYLGRILVNELQSSFKSSQLRLLEYFCKFVAKGFQNYRMNARGWEFPLQKLLEKLLLDESADEDVLLESLNHLGWRQNDSYLTAKAILLSDDDAYAYSICLDIMEGGQDAAAFSQGKELYVVFHLPESEMNPDSYYAFLHEIGLKAGIHFGASSLFFQILRIKEYQEQASIALEYGQLRESERYCHPYHSIALTYFLRNAIGSLKPHIACAAALRILRKTDREKGSDYYNTLKEYIHSNCQPIQAAKSLYLHRGTLTYRLNKIHSLTGLDLNDRDTILYLDLSFRIEDLYQDESLLP